MSQYMELRKKWPEFIYEGYHIEETEEEIRVRYQFRIPGLSEFAPEWKFPKPSVYSGVWSVRTDVEAPYAGGSAGDCEHMAEADLNGFREDPVFRNMIFSLGMVELVSYWKICCPPTVWVEAGCLNREQIDWWKNLYYNGLGEFFYTNRIQEADPDSFMEIRCRTSKHHEPEGERRTGRKGRPLPPLEGCLIPVGGGKDSVVTMELVKKAGMESMVYVINPRGATIHCSQAGGYGPKRQVMASRTLDQNMLRLNREGYLNGHTPFSAIVAFSSVAAAYLHRLKYVALSNESSANESTVPGSTVNHQYSKSFQFEADFNSYERNYLHSGVYYFSLLRPLSEFQIARYFAGLEQYHQVFRSCNAGSRQDVWCGHCPKCLFVFLILSPFLPQKKLRQMFGADMLNDPSLTGTLEQLVGIQEDKPFECVGSRNEINAAIAITIERMEREGEALPVLLRYYRQSDLFETHAHRDHGYYTYYDKGNLLPDVFEKILRQECLPAEG